MSSMIRINVHLSRETIEGLDKILPVINGGRWYSQHTRADLIRYAIGKTFGIPAGYFSNLEEDLTKLVPPKKGKKA